MRDPHELVLNWGRGEAAPIPPGGLHDLFLEQARESPDAVALVTPEARLSYRELAAASAAWAGALAAAGVAPGDRVGVALPRGRDLVAALLGALRAGCAYVPLDPEYPPPRLELIARDSEIRALVAARGHPAASLAPAAALVSPEDVPAPSPGSGWDSGAPGEAPPAPPAEIAYLIYTSGSTGTPKGIPIFQRSAVNLVAWARRAYSAEELAGVLAGTSVCFDLSVFELFVPLGAGGVVVLVSSPLALADGPPPAPVTLINTVPSVLAELIRLDAVPASVRTVNLAGEPLRGGLAEAVFRRTGARRLLNLYAPSETTTYSTWSEVRPGEPRPAIGRPIANTEVYVLDEELRPTAPGVEGEICIGGAGVAAGYLHRPGLERERFLPSPFPGPWPALYRTGDRGVWRAADGQLEFLVRGDEQLKVRGYRIEPAEVEEHLLRLPGVREAAVVARDFGPDDRRLVACVVPAGESPPSPEDLRARLRAELPEFMVPTSWRMVPSLPRLSNGKLDRRALAQAPAAVPARLPAAGGGMLELVVREMAAVLGAGTADPERGFFELGGDSLLAARLAARLRSATGRSLSVAAVFRSPGADALAAALSRLPALAPPEAGPREEGAVPLSPFQGQLWLFQRLYPESASLNVSLLLRREGPRALETLARGWRALAARHPLLRAAGIVDEGGGPAFASGTAPDWRVVETAGLSEEARRALASEEASRSFDLSREPPARALALPAGPEDCWIVLTFHQLAVDGDSLQLLVDGFLDSPPPPSGPGAAGLAGELARLGGDPEAGLRYWRRVLRPPAPELPFPVDHQRAERGSGALRSRRELDAALVEALRGVGRREGVTPYILLLTGLVLALHRVSGQEDLVVGSAFSLRDTPAFDGEIGFHANALPLRVRLRAGESRRDLLRRVWSVVAAAHGHKHGRADLLHRELTRFQGAPGTAPLPVLFGVLPELVPRRSAGEWIAVEELPPAEVQADLSFQARWGSGRAVLTLDARASRFEPATAEWLLEGWLGAARDLAGDLALPLAPPAGPLPAAPPARGGSLWEAFEETARRYADRPAVCQGEEAWSYGELRERALGIAAALAGPGREPVGLLLETGPPAVAAALGALFLGRPYVPLSPGEPPARLRRIAATAGIAAVLTGAGGAALAAAVAPGARVVEVSGLYCAPRPPGRSRAREGSFAYVLFTSGSTGRPKGVVQSQRNVLHHAATYARSLGLEPGDRLTLLTTLAFDAAVMDVFGALLAGAGLHVRALAREGLASVHAWIRREGITVLHCTPSVFRALVAAPEWESPPETLRWVVLGGEPARRSDGELFLRRFGGRCGLVNGYGPTESTVTTQAFFRPGNPLPASPTLPIGRPVAGTEVALLGPRGHAALSGEIEIRGPYVALGYLDGPEDWRRLARVPRGARRHRTGDLARRLPGGGLLHLGRRDDQVKIGGVRVEPAEVEQALLAAGGVDRAFVAAASAPDGEPRLAAWVVSRAGAALTGDSLRAFLRTRLPDPMLPSLLRVVEELPLLPNGKVDRRALPLPETAETQEPEPAGGLWEERVGEVWREVLGLASRPGPGQTFLALGGHSLEALRALAEIRRRWGVDLPPSGVLGEVRLRDVAARVERAAGAVSPAPAGTPAPAPRLPSSQQLRFWFLEQAGTSSLVLLALAFPGRADRAALQSALDLLVARHEALRSRIVASWPTPGLVVDPPRPLPIPWTAAEMPAPPVTPSRLPEELGRPFDLEAGWPLRVAGLETPEGDVLVLAVHHVAADAGSVDVLRRELTAVYGALRRGEGEPALPPAIPYAAAADRLRARLTPELRRRQLAFWTAELAGAPPSLRLAGEPAPAGAAAAERVEGELPEELVPALDAFCRSRGATRTAVLLAAFSALLGRHARQDEVVVGLPVTLRALPEEERAVGPLLNTVAVRCRPGAGSFERLVEEVRDRLVAALDHADVPFEAVVEALGPERDPLRHPIYQALLSYHHAREEPEDPEAPVALDTFGGSVTCDLALTVAEEGRRLRWALDGARGAVHPRAARRMLDELGCLLADALRRPGEDTGRLRLLPDAERRELLVTLNRTPPPPSPEGSLAGRIAAQAARIPDAAAVTAPGAALTYGELDARSAAVAAALAARGIGAGSFVPVLATSGASFVVAVLGVLRSGAAFVPVDPRWPEPWLERALAETAAPLCLGDPGEEVPPVLAPLLLRPSGVPAAPPPRVPEAGPEGPLYAIYTSGTTGEPKAAVIPHRGILNRFAWMTRFLGSGEPPVTLQTTPPVYDSAVWQLLWPLTLGGRCAVPSREALLDADLLAGLIAEQGVTVIDFVPSVLAALLPALESRAESRERLRGLRWIILGGETLTPALAGRLRRLVPAARLVNLYGPTEASIGCVAHEIAGEEPRRVPVGRPLPGVRVALLDGRGGLAPRGAPGEIWLHGACVGLGYLARRDPGGFVPSPVPELREEPAYRTGDLGRWNERGSLEFLGRIDRQLKVRGVRIEPEAIRAALLEDERVAAAAVDAPGDPVTGLPRLRAQVVLREIVPREGRELDAASLKRRLRGVLPPGHVPDLLEIVEALPLAGSGKVDEARLPPPRGPGASPAALGPAEERVRRAWEKLLGDAAGVDPEANFFDVGGHSLLLLALAQELGREFGVRPRVVDLFRHTTLRDQAELFAALGGGSG